MKATLVANRDVYSIDYNQGGGVAVKAIMTNPENGDVSEYVGADDGNFVVTVASGYVGTAEVEIENLDGEVVDSGTVIFGDEPHPEQQSE